MFTEGGIEFSKISSNLYEVNRNLEWTILIVLVLDFF